MKKPTSTDPQSPNPSPSARVYRTPPDRVGPPSFLPLASGGFVVSEPLIDTDTGLYARLSYDDLRAIAKKYGGDLLTMAQVYEIWRDGYRLQPVTLVHSQADFARMQSREFAERHDAAVRKQLKGWDRKKPLANAGKDWIRGAKRPGMARNGGWVTSPTTAIQPGGDGSEHHDAANYTDYSQLARFWIPSLA